MSAPTAPAAPTVLKASSSADFLAAFPRLVGMTAPESLFLVFFGRGERSSRTIGTARIDLPSAAALEEPEVSPELIDWVRQVGAIAEEPASPVMLVVQTEALLTERPAASPHGMLTAVLCDVLAAAAVPLRDALLQGSDGWTSFANDTDQPELRPLDEITESRLHDPEHRPLSVEVWREQHPDCTTDSPDEIAAMTARLKGKA